MITRGRQIDLALRPSSSPRRRPARPRTPPADRRDGHPPPAAARRASPSSPPATSCRTTRSSTGRVPTRAAAATTSARASRARTVVSAPIWRSVTWRPSTAPTAPTPATRPSSPRPRWPKPSPPPATTAAPPPPTTASTTAPTASAAPSDALDRAGVRHAGIGPRRGRGRTVTVLRRAGAQVAHLAYTYDTTASRSRRGSPGPSTLIDADRIVADARAARRPAPTWWSCLAALGHRMAGRSPTSCSCPWPGAHRVPHRPPSRHRPDPRHPRPRPAGVREGQRHLGRLRHGRPDRRARCTTTTAPRTRAATSAPLGRFTFAPPARQAAALAGHEGRVRPAVLRCRRRAGRRTSTRRSPRAPTCAPCATASGPWC